MRLNSLILSLTLVGATAMPLLYAAPAHAQAPRTWVSGVGDDVNPCSRTAPCKTWAGAISKTANGGEIDALDPGGFGAVTITKSMTIDGGGGQVAASVVPGTNGMLVAAQAGDVVVIRNVRFQGELGNGSNAANVGLSAIVFQSGAKLIVDNCDITGFNVNGISVTGTGYVAINNTRMENIANAGVAVTAPAATVDINNVRIYGAKQFGVAVGSGNKVTFVNSVASNSANGVEADAGGNLFVENSVISFNTTGVSVGSTAQIALGNNDIVFNTTGVGGGGTAKTFTNNRFFGNTSDGNALSIINPNPSNPTGQK